MARYQNIPCECEAEQFGGFYAQPYPPGVQMEDNSNHSESGERYQFYVITTHRQRVNIERGDYIVKEPDGNGYYPVKPDIFVKRWKAVQ